MIRIKKVSVQPVAASAAGIAAAQAGTSGTALTLTASPVTLDPPRRVQLTAVGDESSRTFAIAGRDRYGEPITETLAGVNATTGLSAYEYSRIDSITPSGNTAGNVSFGWSSVFYTPWLPVNRWRSGKLGFGVNLQGAAGVAYDVQHTFKEALLRERYNFLTDEDGVFTHDTMAAQNASGDGNYAYPVRAVRLRISTWSSGGPIEFEVHPAGS